MLTVTVQGAVVGTLWMPAVKGLRPHDETFNLRAPQAPFRRRVDSIREALEYVASQDGDFQTAGKLAADTFFTVTRHNGNRKSERTYCVSDFPNALADLVDSDTFASDVYEE